MIEILTDKTTIEQCQTRFENRLRNICKTRINCKLGHLGHSSDSVVYYSDNYDFWFSPHLESNRYWNAFGIGKPKENSNTSITVEINPPLEGINRNIGGAFGKSESDEILILHRGQIGGGRNGIGKQLLIDNFRGEFLPVMDGEQENYFCYIASLESKFLADQIKDFISEVERIKEMKRNNQIEDNQFDDLGSFSFTDEKFGSSKKPSKSTEIERTHGLVVNSLARILESKGFNVGNDSKRDLFLYNNSKTIVTLFEIKTKTDTQSLYTALGQLLIYSFKLKDDVARVFVTTEKYSKDVETYLLSFGIKILYFYWKDDKIIFKDLNSVIDSQPLTRGHK